MPFDPRYFLLLREKRVHELLEREAPDLIEGSSPWTGGWFAARYPKPCPRVLIFHQDPVAVYPHTLLDRHLAPASIDLFFKPFWGYLSKLSRRFDATVVSGEWLADRLSGFGVHAPHAVPFGIDKAGFSPEHRSEEVRRAWLERCGVGPEASLLVGISRHHPEKRIGTMLEAFRRASSERPMGFVLFGDGPLRGWVQKRAKRVPGVCVAGFTKSRDELAQALASADGFLHGSAAETYGLVVAEALCSGLPLIVPDRGGAVELSDPRWAETYETGNAESCSAAILRLLARERSSLAAGCDIAREERVWNVEAHFDALFRYYESLTDTAG